MFEKESEKTPLSAADSYSKVAREYADRIFHELDSKPADRQWLQEFARRNKGNEPICDLGCGPGQVARFLADSGAAAIGVDISAGMVEQARRLNPDLSFTVGDIRELPLVNNSVGGVVAFYSLIHIPRSDWAGALAEIARVIRPGGEFLFSFHIGEETIHLDEWWEHRVNLDFYHFSIEEVHEFLRPSAFEIIDVYQRDPYDPAIEHPSRRAYFLARLPG